MNNTQYNLIIKTDKDAYNFYNELMAYTCGSYIKMYTEKRSEIQDYLEIFDNNHCELISYKEYNLFKINMDDHFDFYIGFTTKPSIDIISTILRRSNEFLTIQHASNIIEYIPNKIIEIYVEEVKTTIETKTTRILF